MSKILTKKNIQNIVVKLKYEMVKLETCKKFVDLTRNEPFDLNEWAELIEVIELN